MYSLQLMTVGDELHSVDAPLTVDIIGTSSSFITELDVATYPAFEFVYLKNDSPTYVCVG